MCKDQCPPRVTLKTHLSELSTRAELLWREYLDKGPGRLSTDAYAEIADTMGRIRRQLDGLPLRAQLSTGWVELLLGAIADLDELLRKCVERAEGLCFVTGEAGLIPRRDLHDRCEAALRALRWLRARLDDTRMEEAINDSPTGWDT